MVSHLYYVVCLVAILSGMTSSSIYITKILREEENLGLRIETNNMQEIYTLSPACLISAS